MKIIPITNAVSEIIERGCDTFSLDSGGQRQRAHPFYFREAMTINSFHLAKPVKKTAT